MRADGPERYEGEPPASLDTTSSAGEVGVSPDRDEPSLDVALYSCRCGFVFEAPVLTSVGCPHCGDHQAW